MNAKEIAAKIQDKCFEMGWFYEVRDDVLTITKHIKGADDFCVADQQYYFILGLLPTTSPGSMWGTDGGGVGALSAMKSGVFKMNKSGGSKRVLNALKKL